MKLNTKSMTVFRIDTRPLSVIVPNGFHARGKDLDNLLSHQKSPKETSGFISTSTLPPNAMMDSSLKGFIENSATNNAALSLPQYTPEEMISMGVEIQTAYPHQWFSGKVKSYIYKIELEAQQGIDVNKTLGKDSAYPDQEEIAVKLSIKPKQIVSVYEITKKFPSGELSISDEIPISNSAKALSKLNHEANKLISRYDTEKRLNFTTDLRKKADKVQKGSTEYRETSPKVQRLVDLRKKTRCLKNLTAVTSNPTTSTKEKLSAISKFVNGGDLEVLRKNDPTRIGTGFINWVKSWFGQFGKGQKVKSLAQKTVTPFKDALEGESNPRIDLDYTA